MADAKSTIELIFEGVDKTGAATQAALGNVKKFGSSVQGATQPIADFTTAAVKLEATLLAAGVAVTAFSVKIAGDFDTAFREIATLIDEPIEGLNDFRQAILDYAGSSTQPLEQVTQAIYSAISAGVDFGESITAVSQAEKLAVAGKADLNDSLIVLVSSLNAYGLGMDSAGRFSDVLFTAVKKGQLTLPELASSLSDVTGTAAQLEIPFETLLASIAAITSTGAPTSKAITQVSAALSALLGPTPQAAAEAKRLGIEFNAQAVKAKGLEVVLQDVATATDGDEAAMKKLFGSIEAVRAILPLVGLAAGSFADNLGAMASSAGATQTAFDIMAASFDNVNQRMQNSLRELFVQLGDPLLEQYGSIADAITAIFNAIGDSANTGAIREMVAFIEGEMAGLQATLEGVAKNMPAALEKADFSGFTNGVKVVSDSIGILFDNIDLSTADGLAEAITTIGVAFNNLSHFTGGVIEGFKPLFDLLTKVGDGMNGLDAESFKATGRLFSFATQANLLSPVLVSLAAGLISVNQAMAIGGTIKAAGAAAGGTASKFATLLPALGTAGVWLGGAAAIGAATGQLLKMAEQSGKMERLVDEILETGISAEKSAALIAEADDAMTAMGSSAENAADMVYNFSTGLFEIDDSVGVLWDLSDATKGVATSMDSAADATSLLGRAAEGLQLEEKLALIEAQSTISVARIEAGAKNMSSAFESVNTTIESTSDLLGNLFGSFDKDLSFSEQFQVEDQIKLENERREEGLRLQNELTEATIAETRARTARLRSGGALITVNGDGLQPHLEAMMFEVLNAVQTRVNAEGYGLLLGN